VVTLYASLNNAQIHKSKLHEKHNMILVINSIFIAVLAGLLANTSAWAQGDYEHFPIAGGELLLEWRGQFEPEQQDRLKSWLVSATNTVTLLHGQLPRKQIRIALLPYPAKSAVPFARVLRQAPEGVLFYINPDRSTDEYINDWTAYHEFSHLFIPYPGKADIWFSEGLASYYQNVLQARAGLLTKDQAREKLRAGFERGKKDSKYAQLTLGELSPVMRDKHAFMRVYWSGALYFLHADLLLRNLPNDNNRNLTLDDVLRQFGLCCLDSSKQWSGLDIAAEFDRISATDIFTTLYTEYENSLAIPEYHTLLESAEMDAILAP
jgi:hypothetical protein